MAEKKQITPETIEKVLQLIDDGNPPVVIKTFISEETGFRKTKCNEIYNNIIKGKDFESDIFDFDLESEDEANKPYFNEESGKYIVYIAALGRNIVVSESKHKRILEMYSNWDGDGKTLNEVCRAIQWPRQVLTQYVKAFGINHDSLPISDEDLKAYDDEELTTRLHELRKFSLYQKFEKEGWDATRAAAQKWWALQYKHINPFKEAIENWMPPIYTPRIKTAPKTNGNTLLSVLADVHFGMIANPQTTFRKHECNSDIIKDRVIELSERVAADAKKQGLSEIVVMLIGDILNSANTQGTTNKGTILDNDLKGGEVFKLALDTLTIYFNNLLNTGLKVKAIGMTGNHDAALGAGLLYAIKSYFRNEITDFEVSNRFIDHTRIKDSMICYSHGAHTDVKAKAPPITRMNGYAQSLFLEAQKTFPNPSSRYYIIGDLHHSKTQEFNDFEFILVPSLAGGGNFSDALNLNSRARQQTFIFDEKGIKTVNNYYFD